MKKTAFALLVVMLFSLAACGSVSDTRETTETPVPTTENLVSDEALVAENPKVGIWDASNSASNNTSTYTVRNMKGVYSLKSFDAEADKTYRISYNLEETSGFVRVFVLNNGKIIGDLPAGTDKSFDVSSVSGKVEVRCASEGTAFKITVRAEEVQAETTAD